MLLIGTFCRDTFCLFFSGTKIPVTIMVVLSVLCFPGFLNVPYFFPSCFLMFLPMFLRFPSVFLLFPRIVSPVSYFRFCGLLAYYFYFSNEADKFSFFLESLFSLCYLSRRLPIVKDFGFMGNKTCHDIKNSFIKNRNLLINTLL